MSIGRSKEEQELTSFLAKTLVEKEVIEPMSKIGWSHGNPPPPEYSGQPAPTEGAPGQLPAPAATAPAGQPAPKPEATPASVQPKADTPTLAELTASFEALRDPETGLIEKKYKTVQDAIKGRVHLNNMAKQAFEQRDELLKRVETLTRSVGQAPAPAPAGPVSQSPGVEVAKATFTKARTDYDAVLSKIVADGGVLDADAARNLSDAQTKMADAAAEVRVQESLNARESAKTTNDERWRSVDAYMAEKHPNAVKFSDEVALHIQSDPLLGTAVKALMAAGNLQEATEMAWLSFERAHGEQVAAETKAKAEEKEADLTAREQVRKEKLEEARKDAGVIQGSAGGAGVHERGATTGSREEIEAAREQMKREGDAPGSPAARRFRELVIGPSLDPTLFGPR